MESFEYTVKVTVPESLRGLFGKDHKKETEAVQQEIGRRLKNDRHMKEWQPVVIEKN